MTPTPATSRKKMLALIAIIAAVGVIAYLGWTRIEPSGPGEGFISGNGRIEATEIDVATKLSGRLEQLLVREGDFVTVGQPLARMQLDTLHAQHDEAEANRQQAEHGVTAAEAQAALRESDYAAAQALIAQRAAELDATQRRLARSQTLSKEGAASMQELDDDHAKVLSAEAALNAIRAQAAAAQAAMRAAQAQIVGAQSSVKAATATQARVEADIRDSELTAPRDGRIQFCVAQTGEVLGAGGRVLNLLDLSNVYMTFFVPETAAGRIALGSEVRIVLDSSPETYIPANVSFVASQAQFTPKTVETASERAKLMFRVRAQIAPELLRRNLEQVKTGVPGVAWIKLDPNAAWPAALSAKVAE
ncbi:MAG: HlyD family efflux transporter periplasmic adaptor subunit [Rhodocyclales bacterium]|nr:HlyD family efflux transporter periplasmic adaptor subunit [Rhodocyclales bacterium]